MIIPIVFLLLAGIYQVRGDAFVLEVQFHSYYNPSHTDFQGNCSSVNCSSSCNNTFFLCLADTNHECVNGSDGVLAGEINDNFTFTPGEPFPNGVSNPVKLSGPATFNLASTAVRIFSMDHTTEPPTTIDIVEIALNISSGGDYTAPMVYNSTNDVFEIELSFRLTCATSYYGALCGIFCSGRDNNMGHYSCNVDGGKICNEGYTNPSTNCTEQTKCTGFVCDDGACKQSSTECDGTSDCSGDNCSSVPVVLIAVLGASAVGGVLLILTIIIITSVAVSIYRRKNAKARIFTTEHKGKKRKTDMEFQSRNSSTIERKLVSDDKVVYDNPLEFIGADDTPTGAPNSGSQFQTQTAIDEPIVHAVTATTNTFQVFTEPNGTDNS